MAVDWARNEAGQTHGRGALNSGNTSRQWGSTGLNTEERSEKSNLQRLYVFQDSRKREKAVTAVPMPHCFELEGLALYRLFFRIF